MTAITVSLLRAEENVPEKRRPSCLSMVSVNAMLLSRGSFAGAARWWGCPPPKTIDSLSPFHVPRRSGIAVWAEAGAAASAASTMIPISFDMVSPPQELGIPQHRGSADIVSEQWGGEISLMDKKSLFWTRKDHIVNI